MPHVFYPSSLSFVKKNAKSLQTAFPGLPLSKAQEATASALGFEGWFDCSSRLKSAHPVSFPDEHVSAAERLLRRYTQIRALVDIGELPDLEVEKFVRYWKLTARAPSALSTYQNGYTETEEILDSLAQGKVPDGCFMDAEDQPTRIAEGILHHTGDLMHWYFQPSYHRRRAMPPYLRGTVSAYLDYEDGHHLALIFPDAFSPEQQAAGLAYLEVHQPWLYEWHTSRVANKFHGVTLAVMSGAASVAPEAWFALSNRQPDAEHANFDCVVPALKGRDFIKFIENKGSLRGLDVQWFGVSDWAVRDQLHHLRFMVGWWDGKRHTNQLSTQGLTPIPPVYGTPFKHGPMHEIEFMAGIEGGGLKLADELEGEQ